MHNKSIKTIRMLCRREEAKVFQAGLKPRERDRRVAPYRVEVQQMMIESSSDSICAGDCGAGQRAGA